MSEKYRSDLLRDVGYEDDEIDQSLQQFTNAEMDREEEAAAEAAEEPSAEEPTTDPPVSEAEESPEEVPAEAASEVEESVAEPEASEASEPEPEPESVDWEARFRESEARFKEIEQQREAERTGFLQRIGGLQERVARQQAQQEVKPPEPVRIPDEALDYDENGNQILKPGWVPPGAATEAAPPMEDLRLQDVELRIAKAEARAAMLQNEGAAEVLPGADAAFEKLGAMVYEAQVQEGSSGVIRDPVEAYRFIESRGIGDLWRQRHGDVAPTRAEMMDLLEYQMTGDVAAGRRWLSGRVKPAEPAPAPAPSKRSAAPVKVTRPRGTGFEKTTMREEEAPDEDAQYDDAVDWNNFGSKSGKDRDSMMDTIRRATNKLE